MLPYRNCAAMLQSTKCPMSYKPNTPASSPRSFVHGEQKQNDAMLLMIMSFYTDQAVRIKQGVTAVN